MKWKWILIVSGLTIASCRPEKSSMASEVTRRYEFWIGALNWFQTSGEYRALCYQAFNTARMVFDQTTTKPLAKKPAVIVDIDETVLDNSPYQANQYFNNTSYPEGWKEWTATGTCRPIPGSVEFLSYAASKGAAVFYVTNRKPDEKEGTIKNLKAVGFPYAEEAYVLFRTDSASKEPRRQFIAKNHTIVLLCGDNLNDFAEGFEKQSTENRFRRVDQLKKEFGTRFIVIPNPCYGDWEGAIYQYQYNRPDSVKARLRLEALIRS